MNPAARGLPEEVRGWSRQLTVPDADGVDRRWHLLDTHAGLEPGDPDAEQLPTLVCVHGNPTWSYLWRRVLAATPPGWRTVAVDQLGMGWSERLGRPRRLAERIDDLDRLLAALGVRGPVALMVHDWGGPVGLGWAVALSERGERHRLRRLVLTNTAVHQPDSPAPALIRAAHTTALRDLACRRTPLFVRAAAALSRPPLPVQVRRALAAPYRSPAARGSVADFVADIPLEHGHPSRLALDAVADGLRGLADVPAVVFWGARDPVFTDVHLADLLSRLPRAEVQRYPLASHLVTEDVPGIAAEAWSWLTDETDRPDRPTILPVRSGRTRPPLWTIPAAQVDPAAPAVVTLRRHGNPQTCSAGELQDRRDEIARTLSVQGVRAGDRVALLLPPSVDLTATVYACWQLRASIVVTDAGLGLRSLGSALRSAAPDHVVGTTATLTAARVLRIPGGRLRLSPRPDPASIPSSGSTPGSADRGVRGDDEAAVLFTSGATGPPKGVVYSAARLQAQLDQVAALIGPQPDDRLVAAFAPFALYGPALGLPAAVPAMDPTRPATLTATALARAVAELRATVVFASPAALANVAATAADLDPATREALRSVRLLLSAGAPVGGPLLEAMARLLPGAELHTPYGMTEMLPVTDVTWDQIRAAGPGNGVLVGRPLPGVEVRIAALDEQGRPADELSDEAELTGEIVVSGPHLKRRYDRQWAVQRQTARPAGWHRTGDVGHLDAEGRLWVEGRRQHVISSTAGPVTPVGPEQRLEQLPDVRQAAVVGVGPAGTQQLAAVLSLEQGSAPGGARRRRSGVLAPPELAAAARSIAGAPLAAVLLTERMPVDVRHQTKIDRVAVGRWAEDVLSGRRTGRLR